MLMPPSPPHPAAKPLYLASGRGWHVSLDGLALRIQAARRAVQFAPVRQITRVLSGTDVSWDTPALLACLDAGIPIVFTDGRGHARAYCHGIRQRERTLSGLLIEAVDNPDWDTRYGQWLHAMQGQAMRRALFHAGLRPHPGGTQGARGQLCALAQVQCGKHTAEMLQQLEACAHGLAMRVLEQAIGNPRLLGHPRPGLCLLTDFADLMSWSVFAMLTARVDRAIAVLGVQRAAANTFEQHADDYAARLRITLDRFELWLREWLQEPEP